VGYNFIVKLLLIILLISTNLQVVNAACGAFSRIWQPDSGTSTWRRNNNWNPRNFPGSTNENAIIKSDWFDSQWPNRNQSLGCLEITSGKLLLSNANRLEVVGDYFKAPILNSITVPGTSIWELRMRGTTAQELNNVNAIPRVDLRNPSTINVIKTFSITNRLNIDNSSGTINLLEGLTVESSASNVTIPNGVTVVVENGATFKVLRNLTVGGVLEIKSGGNLIIGDGRTLNITSAGVLKLSGSAGSVASIKSESGGRYNLTMAGSIFAEYFSFSDLTAPGINTSGSMVIFENGDIRKIATNGYGITLQSSGSMPSTANSIGFFDEGAVGTQRNVNATAYNGSSILFADWSGIGDTPNENDPNNKVDWGSSATPGLQVINVSPLGSPPANVNVGDSDVLFATIGFSMSGTAATATDITNVKITLGGINSAADVSSIDVFNDNNDNCTFESGTDLQIGSSMVPSGAPASVDLSIPAGVVNVIDTNQKCIFVFYSISPTAQDDNTVIARIANSDDVVNSLGYDYSLSGAPPLNGATATIVGATSRFWHGGNGSPAAGGNYSQTNNWTPNGLPSSTIDCQIGPAYSYPVFPNTTTRSCLNATLPDNGRMSWANRATPFSIHGSLLLGDSYTFTSAQNGIISFDGSNNQSINAETNFPGNVRVNNTGASVSLSTDWEIDGDFTVNSGNFVITAGSTLTVNGNINVNGGQFIIEPGGKLLLDNNSNLNVGVGGTLNLVGNNSSSVIIDSTGPTSTYNVNVNGTIRASNYSFSHLGTNGLVINSGATINSVHHLQSGSFTSPVNNNSTFLRLNRSIPGGSLANMVFDSAGSGATNITNIRTNTSAGAVLVDNYSGDWSGEGFDNDPIYLVNWGALTNTIILTREASTPSLLNQGQTYNMGRFGFRQTTAGAFSDTEITSLELTLIGTGDAGDSTDVRVYYDSDCNSTGGTLLGSGTFSGVPATVSFTGLTGAIIDSSLTSPPLRCIYALLDVDSLATSGETLGLSIAANTDVTNSENFAFNGGFAPEVNLGTPGTINGTISIWTGNVSTDWDNPGNWNGGVPTSTQNCIINDVANDPIISSGTKVCKSITIGNGTLTMTGGGLDIFGSFENTGTLNQNDQTITIKDDGVNPTTQSLKNPGGFDNLSFDKTAGGLVKIEGSSLAVKDAVTLPASNDFTFEVDTGKTLELTGGLVASGPTMKVEGNATICIGNGNGIIVNGSSFLLEGNIEAMPAANPLTTVSNFYTTPKARLKSCSGTFSFLATSGDVTLKGFVVTSLDNNGFRVNGTTVLNQIEGGQFDGLSTNYGAMTALELSTTGSIPSSASKVGFNWETSTATEGNTPANTEPYTLIASTGCGGQAIDFSEWTGDWYEETPTFDVSTKVSTTAGCTIVLGDSISAVSLVSFSVQGKDSLVNIRWSTLFENNHAGFNLYRMNDSGDLVKINTSLITNDLGSVAYKGNYEFDDINLENEKSYIYYLEDVDITGKKTLHGPRVAYTGIDNDASDSTIDDNGSSTTPSEDDSISKLSGGVEVINQTDTSLVIRVKPSALTIAASTYETGAFSVSIDDYEKINNPGYPQLLSRVILVPINKDVSSFNILTRTMTESVAGTQSIEKAVIWSLNSSQQLVAQQVSVNDSEIALLQSSLNYVDVANDIISVGDQAFLKVTVHPLDYDISTDNLKRLDEEILEISLDQNAPSVDFSSSMADPSFYSDTLRIDVSKKGMVKLLFTDLVSTYTAIPFRDVDVDDLRLFHGTSEIPFMINDSNGVFDEGDSIIFFADYKEGPDSFFDRFVLAQRDLYGTGLNPLRSENFDASFSNNRESSQTNVEVTKVFEENNDVLLYESLGSSFDHFIWKVLYGSFSGFDELDVVIETPFVDVSEVSDSTIAITLKGGSLDWGETEFIHDINIYLNDFVTPVKNLQFKTKEMQTLSFNVPHSLFNQGTNTLKIKVMGTFSSPLTQVERVAIDKVELTYRKLKALESNLIDFVNEDPNTVVTLEGFESSTVDIWDISKASVLGALENIQVQSDGNGKFNASFMTSDYGNDVGERFFAINNNNYLVPSFLSLSSGYSDSLRDPSRQADFLIIGANSLLSSVEGLAQLRRSEGHSVEMISLDQIYAEFSKGLESADAIRDFIQFTQTSWSSPKVKYILFVGDGTFDYSDKLDYQTVSSKDFPMRLEGGRFIDFASDDYFINLPGTSSNISVGRIPTNNKSQIQDYVTKVIDYENGLRSPQEFIQSIQYFAGEKEEGGARDFNQDRFDSRIDKLMTKTNSLKSERMSWHDYSGDADARSALIAHIQDKTPLIMTYMGHGAPNLWGSSDFVVNTHIDQLINEELPIVMSLNCENTLFYDPDRSNVQRTMGEAFIFNPNGGSVAFIGSSTQTTATAQERFAEEFLKHIDRQLTSGVRDLTLGDMIRLSKSTLAKDHYSKDVVRSMMLFGDPMIKLPAGAYQEVQSVSRDSNQGGGGCSLGASNGKPISYMNGLFEMMMMLLAPLLLMRIRRRKSS